ncbi:hypothetical protein, partial [Pseudothermotoga sp.]|uniref:hypothetical protein n=1 Tax=Pseudothermotoga sp. TaxID=2033661 RepID=UPI000E8952C8
MKTKTDVFIEPITIRNLLGKCGNFEVDSNGDGLADGWTGATGYTYSLISGISGNAQKIYYDNSAGTATVTPRIISQQINNVAENDVIFVSAYMKIESENTETTYNPVINVLAYDATDTLLLNTSFECTSTVWQLVKGKVTLPAGTSYIVVRALQNVQVENIGSFAVDNYVVYNLTAMGDLPYGIKSYLEFKYPDTTFNKWEEVPEDDLAELLPYVDGVQTLELKQLVNRGKNLFVNLRHELYASDGTYDPEIKGNSDKIYVDTLPGAGQYADIIITDWIWAKNRTFTLQASGCDAYHNLKIYGKTGDAITLLGTLDSSTPITVNVTDEYIAVGYSIDDGAGLSEITNIQLEEGNTATTYTPSKNELVSIKEIEPKVTLYGTTIVNLLGKYGNFEVDSNADGLADWWEK